MKRVICVIGLLAVMFTAVFAQEKPQLAVVDFTTNINTEKVRSDTVMIRNLVESAITGTNRYTVITRDKIDELLKEQKIAVSSISSNENREKLQLRKISYIVTGSVNAIDNNYAITINVLDVSSGEYPNSKKALLGNSAKELFEGLDKLIDELVKGMSVVAGGAIVQGTVVNPTGISIEVKTDKGGDLYLQGEKIATLWDNDTHTIPIERPGIYSLRLVLINENEKITSVTISSRGVIKVDFSGIAEKIKYFIGKPGPAGGLIFYDKGTSSNGWQYLEAAPESSEFVADLDEAARRCYSLNIGGLSGWRLPSRDELDLMDKNLKQKGLGGFGSGTYWSSSGGVQSFSHGYLGMSTTNDVKRTVRAVRAF